MWWLLIPVVTAVVAAVVNSDDEEKEAAVRRAREAADREAIDKAKAAAIAADLVKRKTQLVTDVNSQLSDLICIHPNMVKRSSTAAPNVSFETLQSFANKEPAIRPSSLLKQLDDLAPGLSFSPTWTARAEQVLTLHKEITGLKRLKEELQG